MSLEDIFGRTAETRILDLFIENYGNAYTQWEIYELTGISRSVLYKKLPHMVDNDLLVISGKVGNHKAYSLAKNKAVKQMVAFLWDYRSVEAARNEIAHGMAEPEPVVSSENRYYKDPSLVPDDIVPMPQIQKEKSSSFIYRPSLLRANEGLIKKMDIQSHSRAITAQSA